MPVGREALHHVAYSKADATMHLHFVLEITKLLRCGEFTPDQQIGGLQETAVDCEVIEGVAPIGETPLQAVNVANRGLGGGDTLKTGSEHQPRAFMPDFVTAGLTHHHPLQQLINAT
jgi:hypothetical protein